MNWSNDSSTHYESSSADWSAYESLAFLGAMLLTILSNGFFLQLIIRKRTLRNASNIILAGLAFSDLLMGAVGIPLVFSCNISPDSRLLCISSSIFVSFISYSTVVHISLHTYDRYLYLSQALRYTELMPKRRAYRLLAIGWAVTLTASGVKFIWCTGVDEHDDVAVQTMHTITAHYAIFTFVVFFCLPLVAIVFMDVRMMRLVHSSSVLMCTQTRPSDERARSIALATAQSRKSVITCIIVLTVYVVCWFPYFVLEWLDRTAADADVEVTIVVLWILYYIRFFSSICNPWLYTLRKRDMKKAACSRVRRRQLKRNKRKRKSKETNVGI